MNGMNMNYVPRATNESGFSLVELAIVMLIAGLVVGAAMTATRPYLEYTQYNATQRKMRGISDALAMYAQQHNRLPCPAQPNPGAGNEPLGAPRNSGSDGAELDNDCGTGVASHIGVVPWRVLGLDEELVRDGFGNMITYAVSPVLAGTTTGGVDNVHAMCRQTDIWVQGGVNVNPGKARFCCPRYLGGTNGAMEVVDEDDDPVYTVEQDTGGFAYANLHAHVTDPPDRNSAVIAFVLVSHGRNGDGAFVTRSDFPVPVTGPAASHEQENRNGDRVFRHTARSRSNDASFFDDVVMWRTNHQLYSAYGNNSCMRP